MNILKCLYIFSALLLLMAIEVCPIKNKRAFLNEFQERISHLNKLYLIVQANAYDCPDKTILLKNIKSIEEQLVLLNYITPEIKRLVQGKPIFINHKLGNPTFPETSLDKIDQKIALITSIVESLANNYSKTDPLEPFNLEYNLIGFAQTKKSLNKHDEIIKLITNQRIAFFTNMGLKAGTYVAEKFIDKVLDRSLDKTQDAVGKLVDPDEWASAEEKTKNWNMLNFSVRPNQNNWESEAKSWYKMYSRMPAELKKYSEFNEKQLIRYCEHHLQANIILKQRIKLIEEFLLLKDQVEEVLSKNKKIKTQIKILEEAFNKPHRTSKDAIDFLLYEIKELERLKQEMEAKKQ